MDFDDPNFQSKFEHLLKSLDTLAKNTDSQNAGKVGGWDWKEKNNIINNTAHVTKAVHGHMHKAVDGASNAISKLSAGAEGLTAIFKDLAGAFLVGKIFSSLYDGGKKLSDTYSKLSNVGQTFGGSMIQMAQQAAAAGLPLNDFTTLLMRQSTAAAVMATTTSKGSVTMGMFAKGVVSNLQSVGMYGMTLEQVNDLSADYAELLRKQNLLTGSNTKTNTASVLQFASDLSSFSQVTGKAKDEISREVQTAMSDTSLGEVPLTADQMQKLTGATSFLASLPGDAGANLSQMLTQTVGMGGVQFTNQAQEFYGAGTGQLLQPIQELANKAMNGTASNSDYVSFVKYMQSQDTALMPYLQGQIAAGNQQAVAVAAMLQSMRGLDAEKFAQQQKIQAGLTKFFSDLQVTLNTLTTSFEIGFYAALAPIQNLMGDSGQTLITTFSGALGSLGAAAGKFIQILLDPKVTSNFASLFRSIGKFINSITTDDMVRWSKEIKSFIVSFVDVLKMGVKAMSWLFNMIAKHPVIASIAGGGLLGNKLLGNPIGAVIGFAFQGLLKKIFGVGVMDVKAGVVNVTGKGSSLLDNLGGGTGGKSPWWKKLFNRGGANGAETAAVDGTKVAETAAVDGAEALVPEAAVAAPPAAALGLGAIAIPAAIAATIAGAGLYAMNSSGFKNGISLLGHPGLIAKELNPFHKMNAKDFQQSGWSPTSDTYWQDLTKTGADKPNDPVQQQLVKLVQMVGEEVQLLKEIRDKAAAQAKAQIQAIEGAARPSPYKKPS